MLAKNVYSNIYKNLLLKYDLYWPNSHRKGSSFSGCIDKQHPAVMGLNVFALRDINKQLRLYQAHK